MAAGQKYNKTLNYDEHNVKTPAFYDPNLDEWLMASANVVKTESGLFVFQKGTDDGKAKVLAELSGSNLEVAAVVNVAFAGTRQQLPDKACREVTIIAKRGNTGYIYVGKGDVSSTVFGAELGELDSITLAVSNTNQIYIDASVSGEGISYVAI